MKRIIVQNYLALSEVASTEHVEMWAHILKIKWTHILKINI